MLHLSLLPFVLFAEHMSLAQLPCHLTAPQEEMALPLLRAINGPDGCSPSLSYSLFPSFLFLFYFLFLFSQPTPTFFSLDMNPSFKHSLIFFGLICSVTQTSFYLLCEVNHVYLTCLQRKCDTGSLCGCA